MEGGSTRSAPVEEPLVSNLQTSIGMTKMKLLKVLPILITLFVGLLLSSCNKAELKPQSPPEQDIETQANLLTEEEAVVQVQNLYGALFGKGLRSESTPEVLSVQKTSVPQDTETREGEGVFVVNFKDNRGYVVLSTSKYNEPIIAANDHGFLDISVSYKQYEPHPCFE